MITSSFGRERPLIFSKVDSITSSNSTTHPLLQLKTYAKFSHVDSQTGVKERIWDEMTNITSFINDNITSRLSTIPVASLLAHTFLIRSTQAINSLLTWIDHLYLDLQAVGQSSSDTACHLVCFYIQCFFKELRKV